MTTVLCVPQCQGSAAKNAPLLLTGAQRTAEILRADTVVTVPVVNFDDDVEDGVRGLGTVAGNIRLVGDALAQIDDFVITAGGDCGVDVAPIAAARRRYGDRLTVLWIDAHPDVYGPGELASGSFHGMVVRTLLGDRAARLTPDPLLTPAQVVLAGIRAGDACEREYVRRTGLRVHAADELERAFEGLDGPTYVHIDLDVLDPGEFGSVGYPEPNGVRPARLAELISGLDDVVGAAITEHAPAGANAAEDEVVRSLGAALSHGQRQYETG